MTMTYWRASSPATTAVSSPVHARARSVEDVKSGGGSNEFKLAAVVGSEEDEINGYPGTRPRPASEDKGDRVASEPVSGEARPAKKRKKKGWKGWVVVVEDEKGNVLEVRDRGESPRREGQGDVEPSPMSREGSAVDIDALGRKGRGSSSPFVSARTDISRSKAPDSAQSTEPVLKKRKKNSPTTTPQPDSRPGPSTSKPPQPKKGPRASAGSAAPTRSGTSAAREEARLASATSRIGTPTTAPLILSDEPLPKIPRVGMGEVYPPPPESDLRAEAAHIINAAKKKREEERIRILREEEDGGELDRQAGPLARRAAAQSRRGVHRIQGWDPGDSNAAKGKANTRSGYANGNGVGVYATPITAPIGFSESALSHRPPSHYSPDLTSSDTGPSTASTSPHRRATARDPHGTPYPALPLRPQPRPSTPQSGRSPRLPCPPQAFEADFEAMTNHYQSATRHDDDVAEKRSTTFDPGPSPADIALGRGPDDPRPPRFHEGQRPTVVLVDKSGVGKRTRDKNERDHMDGYEGLANELQHDTDGFVNNVRDNLRNIVLYFFPQPTARRDAFLERVGRGLVDFGWQLTDSADGGL